MSHNNLLTIANFSFTHSGTKQSLSSSSASLKSQNLLLLTARKIFFIITELQVQESNQDIDYFYRYLMQELKNFQEEVKKIKCINSDSALIARYILCVTLDEILSKMVVKRNLVWNHPSFIEIFYNEGYADENFFIILDRLCQAPRQYIDLIELMYICLNLGYEGRFKNQPFNQAQLQRVIYVTYQIIRENRGEIDKQLSPSLNLSYSKQAVSFFEKKKKKYFFRSILSILFIIFALDVLFNYLLQICSNPLLTQLQQATEMLVK